MWNHWPTRYPGYGVHACSMLLWPVADRGIWLRSSLAGLAAALAFLCKEQFLVVSVLLLVYTVVGCVASQLPFGTTPLAHLAAAVRWPCGGPSLARPPWHSLGQ